MHCIIIIFESSGVTLSIIIRLALFYMYSILSHLHSSQLPVVPSCSYVAHCYKIKEQNSLQYVLINLGMQL